MLKLSFALLIMSSTSVLTLSNSCQGVHEYKDEFGECQICESCLPGWQPSSHRCGFGTKSPSYRCVQCLEGSFSSGNDYEFCKTCKPCQMWNALVSIECSPTQNAECGSCYSGYFRHLKSNGKPDEECHKCHDDSEEPECNSSTTPWALILVLSLVGIVVLSVIITVGTCMLCKNCRRKRSKTQEQINNSKQRSYTRVTHVLTCANNDDTVNSTSLTPLTSASDILVDSKPGEHLTQLEDCFTNRQIEEQRSHCDLMDGCSYTQHPTAEYHQPSIGHPTNYSNLSTAQFLTNDNMPAAVRSVTVRNQTEGGLLGGTSAGFVPDTPSSNRHDFLQVESFDTSSMYSAKHCATYESKPTLLLVDDKNASQSRLDATSHQKMPIV